MRSDWMVLNIATDHVVPFVNEALARAYVATRVTESQHYDAILVVSERRVYDRVSDALEAE